MGGKILVVDDEGETLNLLKATLVLEGYEVAAAITGKAGVELASEFRPDVILLDVMMPDLTGLEVLEIIKKQLKSPPPVIFLSAAGRVDDIDVGLKAGAYKYLVKPIPRATLIETVKSALEWRQKAQRRRIY
ncbi:MAG: response regulator [Chloroflexi bacterium]|nr:response regulator [Chloroflexota bacterium]